MEQRTSLTEIIEYIDPGSLNYQDWVNVGKRPSSIIIGQQLTPASLGALLAHFENKIMFQKIIIIGHCWCQVFQVLIHIICF